MLAGEGVDLLADDDAEVLQAHLVDALVDGWDELDERDDLAVEDASGSESTISEIGRPFQKFSRFATRVALEERPEVDVLIPLGDADREVTELVRRDVDAAGNEGGRAASPRRLDSPR